MKFTLQQRFYIIFVKRPIDILGAFIAIIVLLPIFIATIVILYFTNKNGWKGVFFVQPRPGKNEKIFNTLKFKTMTDETDCNGNLLPDAKRLTKMGRFIRSTSIDELPQLFNVLKGDMSLIGPRPLYIRYLPYYTEKERLRHTLRPGITGLAQCMGRKSINWKDKLRYDLEYIERISLFLDIKILWSTIVKVVKREDVGVGTSGTNDFNDYREREWLESNQIDLISKAREEVKRFQQ